MIKANVNAQNSSTKHTQVSASVTPVQHSSIFIEDRKITTITGVDDLISYNQNELVVQTALGLILISGTNILVEKLDVDTKELTFKGTVNSLIYSNKTQEKKSILKRIIN